MAGICVDDRRCEGASARGIDVFVLGASKEKSLVSASHTH